MGLSPNVKERTLPASPDLNFMLHQPGAAVPTQVPSPRSLFSHLHTRRRGPHPEKVPGKRAAEGVGVLGDSSIVTGLCEDRQRRVSPSGRKLRAWVQMPWGSSPARVGFAGRIQ